MSDRVDAFVSMAHYEEHLTPILDALPADLRGELYAPSNVGLEIDGRWRQGHAPNSTMPLLVAGFQDTPWSHRPKVLVQHGAGQTYNGVEHGSYAGGPGHDMVNLFLCPNELTARAEQARYPNTRAVAVGCPKLDGWARIPRPAVTDPVVVAVTFHWQAFLNDEDGKPVPEAGWAWETWRGRIEALARLLPGQVLGHGHPRAQRWLRAWWDEIGVEFVPRARDLLDRAHVLVLDNSSLGYEWAALDRSTVWLRGADWRPDDMTGHGLRFGEKLPGPEVWATAPLDELVDAVNVSMHRFTMARAEVRRRVYGEPITGAARRAADAIVEFIG